MRGRKPKPTALKLADGNPGQRAIDEREPCPPKGIGEPPAWLDDEARRQWFQVAADLEAIGMLARVDGPSLAAYCAAISTWAASQRDIYERGLVLENDKGVRYRNPAWLTAKEAMVLIDRFASGFGLTPAARCRIKVTDSSPKDELAEFLDAKHA